VIATASGDAGARGYLVQHGVTLVECSDIGSGEDIDTPEELS
jgi:CTP:molybdopterin cytidylyltransferase MocA